MVKSHWESWLVAQGKSFMLEQEGEFFAELGPLDWHCRSMKHSPILGPDQRGPLGCPLSSQEPKYLGIFNIRIQHVA